MLYMQTKITLYFFKPLCVCKWSISSFRLCLDALLALFFMCHFASSAGVWHWHLKHLSNNKETWHVYLHIQSILSVCLRFIMLSPIFSIMKSKKTNRLNSKNISKTESPTKSNISKECKTTVIVLTWYNKNVHGGVIFSLFLN